MSLSAAALNLLLEKGLTLADAAELASVIEADAPKRSSGAERQARYRLNKAARDASDVTGDVTPVTESPPEVRPLSPQTPLTPTPTPPENTTRARGDAAFARFWLAYPRKTAKGDARKAFDRAIRKLCADPNRDPEQVLIGGLERAKASWVDAQFIPHPATWLNGERWDDEPETAKRSTPHERPHHDAKFEARQANLARHERGADLAARLHRDAY